MRFVAALNTKYLVPRDMLKSLFHYIFYSKFAYCSIRSLKSIDYLRLSQSRDSKQAIITEIPGIFEAG